MRTALLTFFTIALLSTALAASALGALDSVGGTATSNAIVGVVTTERQVGTPEALPPVVLLPPTSGLAPAPVGSVVAQLPNTSTAPSTATLSVLVAAAGIVSGFTLLALVRRRR
jgi:hypothetical protein